MGEEREIHQPLSTFLFTEYLATFFRSFSVAAFQAIVLLFSGQHAPDKFGLYNSEFRPINMSY